MSVFVSKRNRNKMSETGKPRLSVTTIVYWVLLLYIVAALVWWFFSLYTQNETMYRLRKQHVETTIDPSSAEYRQELARIADLKIRNNAKYIGEGATFFILILIGAVYIYRSVRRQFKSQ